MSTTLDFEVTLRGAMAQIPSSVWRLVSVQPSHGKYKEIKCFMALSCPPLVAAGSGDEIRFCLSFLVGQHLVSKVFGHDEDLQQTVQTVLLAALVPRCERLVFGEPQLNPMQILQRNLAVSESNRSDLWRCQVASLLVKTQKVKRYPVFREIRERLLCS